MASLKMGFSQKERMGKKISDVLNQYKKSLLFYFIVVASFFIYLLLFISYRTDVDPLYGTMSSFLSSFIIILPTVMYSTLLVRKDTDMSQNRIDYAGYAAAICMGAIHVILTGIILHYTLGVYSLFILVILGVIPAIVTMVRWRSLIAVLMQLDGVIRNHFVNLILLFGVSLLVRFPFFTTGETGSDSFLFHGLVSYLLQNNSMTWVLSPLDIIEWSPTGKIASPIIYVASFAFLSNLSIEICAFLYSLNLGVLSSFFLLMCAKYCGNILKIERWEYLWVTTFLYATLPLLVKFSDWTITGRLVFLYLVPAMLILTLYLVFQEDLSLKDRAIHWSILLLASILSHGMGRLFIVFGILLFLLHRLDHKYNFKLGILESEKHLRLLTLFMACILFIVPYIFAALGSNALLGTWVFTRTGLTDGLGRETEGHIEI